MFFAIKLLSVDKTLIKIYCSGLLLGCVAQIKAGREVERAHGWTRNSYNSTNVHVLIQGRMGLSRSTLSRVYNLSYKRVYIHTQLRLVRYSEIHHRGGLLIWSRYQYNPAVLYEVEGL